VREKFSNRKFQVLFNGGLGLVLLGVSIYSVRRFANMGWPLHHADPLLASAAFVLYLVAVPFKAWGWQRLFAKHERPGAGALAFAGGAACIGGIALPGRADDAVRIAVVRRFPGTRTGFGTIAVSLLVLGMLDNAALTPLATVAAANAHTWTIRAGFAVVAVAGVAAASIVAYLPRLARSERAARFRAGRWLASHAHYSRETVAALVFISIAWALRGTSVFLLLNALSLKGSFPLALAFLCASAASAALPIAPAGAATQAGAGAAILIASGVHAEAAIAFSIAAQAIVIVTGAAALLLVAAWQVALRVRRLRVAVAPV